MKRAHVLVSLALTVILSAGWLAPAAGALAGSSYELSASTVAAGGGVATGGDYALEGTAGQSDAGAASGGSYTIAGGYWSDPLASLYALFLPVLTR